MRPGHVVGLKSFEFGNLWGCALKKHYNLGSWKRVFSLNIRICKNGAYRGVFVGKKTKILIEAEVRLIPDYLRV